MVEEGNSSTVQRTKRNKKSDKKEGKQFNPKLKKKQKESCHS